MLLHVPSPFEHLQKPVLRSSVVRPGWLLTRVLQAAAAHSVGLARTVPEADVDLQRVREAPACPRRAPRCLSAPCISRRQGWHSPSVYSVDGQTRALIES